MTAPTFPDRLDDATWEVASRAPAMFCSAWRRTIVEDVRTCGYTTALRSIAENVAEGALVFHPSGRYVLADSETQFLFEDYQGAAAALLLEFGARIGDLPAACRRTISRITGT